MSGFVQLHFGSAVLHWGEPSRNGIISPQNLKSCQSAVPGGDGNRALAGEVQTKGKQVDIA